MKYSCSHCSYATNQKSHYASHQKGSKHIINVLKHENDILKDKNNKMSKENKNLKVELQDNKINYLEEALETSNNTSDKVLSALTNSQKIQKKQISAMNYITQNYANAPNIESIEIDVTDDELLAIYVDPYTAMSKILMRHYVNDVDVKNRSIWCTDLSRFKFILKHDGKWIIDFYGKNLHTISTRKILDRAHEKLQTELEVLNMRKRKPTGKIIEIYKRLLALGNLRSETGHKTIMRYFRDKVQLER
jgi:hypothetical protein